MLHKWTDEVEALCEKLRINCVNLSEYHRRRYYHFKSYGKYFRLPMIILASINSTASVGLQPVLDQQYISGITCLIGMFMGIIGAIELYMGIQSSMELELKQSKEFYSLAIDLYKTLRLKPENRGEDGKDYLNKKYGVYTKLCEASNLLKRKLTVDLLTTIPEEFTDKTRSVTPMEISRGDGTKKIVFKEHKSWLQYICCCLYDADSSTDSYIGGDKNLALYSFPNMEAGIMNSPRIRKEFTYETTSEDDIENQYRAYREAESSKTILSLGFEPEPLIGKQEVISEKSSVKEERVSEQVNDTIPKAEPPQEEGEEKGEILHNEIVVKTEEQEDKEKKDDEKVEG